VRRQIREGRLAGKLLKNRLECCAFEEMLTRTADNRGRYLQIRKLFGPRRHPHRNGRSAPNGNRTLTGRKARAERDGIREGKGTPGCQNLWLCTLMVQQAWCLPTRGQSRCSKLILQCVGRMRGRSRRLDPPCIDRQSTRGAAMVSVILQCGLVDMSPTT